MWDGERVTEAGEQQRVVRVLPDVAAIDKEFDYLVPDGVPVQVGDVSAARAISHEPVLTLLVRGRRTPPDDPTFRGYRATADGRSPRYLDVKIHGTGLPALALLCPRPGRSALALLCPRPGRSAGRPGDLRPGRGLRRTPRGGSSGTGPGRAARSGRTRVGRGRRHRVPEPPGRTPRRRHGRDGAR